MNCNMESANGTPCENEFLKEKRIRDKVTMSGEWKPAIQLPDTQLDRYLKDERTDYDRYKEEAERLGKIKLAPRTCVTCKHFEIDHPTRSDDYAASGIECGKIYSDGVCLNMEYNPTLQEVRKELFKAQTCEHYEEAE